MESGPQGRGPDNHRRSKVILQFHSRTSGFTCLRSRLTQGHQGPGHSTHRNHDSLGAGLFCSKTKPDYPEDSNLQLRWTGKSYLLFRVKHWNELSETWDFRRMLLRWFGGEKKKIIITSLGDGHMCPEQFRVKDLLNSPLGVRETWRTSYFLPSSSVDSFNHKQDCPLLIKRKNKEGHPGAVEALGLPSCTSITCSWIPKPGLFQ
jgi:hypothetical protein